MVLYNVRNRSYGLRSNGYKSDGYLWYFVSSNEDELIPQSITQFWDKAAHEFSHRLGAHVTEMKVLSHKLIPEDFKRKYDPKGEVLRLSVFYDSARLDQEQAASRLDLCDQSQFVSERSIRSDERTIRAVRIQFDVTASVARVLHVQQRLVDHCYNECIAQFHRRLIALLKCKDAKEKKLLKEKLSQTSLRKAVVPTVQVFDDLISKFTDILNSHGETHLVSCEKFRWRDVPVHLVIQWLTEFKKVPMVPLNEAVQEFWKVKEAQHKRTKTLFESGRPVKKSKGGGRFRSWRRYIRSMTSLPTRPSTKVPGTFIGNGGVGADGTVFPSLFKHFGMANDAPVIRDPRTRKTISAEALSHHAARVCFNRLTGRWYFALPRDGTPARSLSSVCSAAASAAAFAALSPPLTVTKACINLRSPLVTVHVTNSSTTSSSTTAAKVKVEDLSDDAEAATTSHSPSDAESQSKEPISRKKSRTGSGRLSAANAKSGAKTKPKPEQKSMPEPVVEEEAAEAESVEHPTIDKEAIKWTFNKICDEVLKTLGLDRTRLLVKDKHVRDFKKQVTAKLKEEGLSVDMLRSVASCDPGIATFLTIFDAKRGLVFEFGGPDPDVKKSKQGPTRTSTKLYNLLLRMQTLQSKAAKSSHQKRRSLKRVIRRLLEKAKNLVTELHTKAARFLAEMYDVVLLPQFLVSTLVHGKFRKLRRKTIRQLLHFRHFDFRNTVKEQCERTGTVVLFVGEAYTSKTCNRCGTIRHNLGGSRTFHCYSCGLTADRDHHGARGVLVRNHELAWWLVGEEPPPADH